MDTKIHITLGFKEDGIYFGWHEGRLYQLPYTVGEKYYGLRVLRKKTTKAGWSYYHVRRKKLGIEKLRAILKPVSWEVNKPIKIDNKNGSNGKVHDRSKRDVF